jgi:hypothetical protein
MSHHDAINVISGGSVVRTQIQLTEEQVKEVKKIAQARHISVAEIIREALNNVIRSGAGVAVNVEDQRMRALKAVGKYSSGKHDISGKHDKYLSEAFKK